MPYCGEWSLTSEGIHVRKAVTIYCRSWACEDCAGRRAAQLRQVAKAGKPNRFITLTVQPDRFGGAEQSARELVMAWRKIRGELKQKFKGVNVAFLAVIERTKQGAPHLHILARCPWIDQKWLSKRMDDLLAAPIVHIRHIDAHGRAAAYVAKYLAKAPTKLGTLKRYWKSQDYEPKTEKPVLEEAEPGARWEKQCETIYRWAWLLQCKGWAVTFDKPGRCTALRASQIMAKIEAG